MTQLRCASGGHERLFSIARLVDSFTSLVLLAPSLLICLACATPFPIENLEEGMTAETVRENFGEPEAIDTVWDPTTWTYDAESSWTYVHEEQNPWELSVVVSLLFPPQIVATVIGIVGTLVTGRLGFQWDWAYIERKPVVLHFEQEKLARWKVIEHSYSPNHPYNFDDW